MTLNQPQAVSAERASQVNDEDGAIVVLTMSDDVIARIAQAVQEAMIFSADVTDILRAMKLSVAGAKVVLAPGYAEAVRASHAKLVAMGTKSDVAT